MKRHLQCAEQQDSSSNVTKYTAPATQNDSHDWCPSHMKRHLQCAEQQDSSSNVTKYCTCHVKWHAFMIDPRDIWNVIYNARSKRCHTPTSPSTAPATQNDSHHWSSWHIKRDLQCAEQQNSPSIVPATPNDTHEWCPSHMKHHLQCAEQQDSPSNVTKYCACHVKWLSWLMPVTYETSFTMRGATGITPQPHQILRLPRKIAFQNLREIVREQTRWIVI